MISYLKTEVTVAGTASSPAKIFGHGAINSNMHISGNVEIEDSSSIHVHKNMVVDQSATLKVYLIFFPRKI